jgi:hypothetical protein
VRALEVLDERDLVAARIAPGGPKIDEDELPALAGDLEAAPVEGRQRDGRRYCRRPVQARNDDKTGDRRQHDQDGEDVESACDETTPRVHEKAFLRRESDPCERISFD